MAKKNQSKRLTNQHKKSLGVIGIFGQVARQHDLSVGEVAQYVLKYLEKNILISHLGTGKTFLNRK